MGNSENKYKEILEREREKAQKEKENMEKYYKEELQRLKEESLMSQIEQYKKSLKIAEEEKMASYGEQIRRMEMMRSEQKRMEDALLRRVEEARNEAERKAAEIEQKKVKERNEKQKKVLEEFRKKKDSIITIECDKIKEQFIKNSNDFCLKEIKQYDKSEIDKLVHNIEISENVEFILEEQISLKTKDFLQEKGSSVIKHINVVLVGPSGVGKSTLVNSALNLDKSLGAKEGEAEPCTMGTPQYYDSQKMNYIRIADSRGIEKSKEYGVDEVVKDVKDFVEGQLLTKNPDKYVHCIWYCITGARFEEVERESLERLSSIYDNNKLPIIVVYTKAMVPDIYKPIESKVKKLNGHLEFVPVISKDIIIEEEYEDDDEEEDDNNSSKKRKQKIIKKKGVKKLLGLTIDKAKQAVQSSCYTGIKNIIKEDVIKNMDIQNKHLEEYIKQENNKKINKFTEQMDFKEMIYSISDIISDVVKFYLYNGTKSLNENSIDKIQYFLEKFFNHNLKEYKDIFGMFIEENAENIAKEVYELQKEINLQNGSIMGFVETKEELKKQIKMRLIEELRSKAELYCLRNSAFFISEPIRNAFSKLVMTLFLKCLENDTIIKLFEDSAMEMFNKLKLTNKNGGNTDNRQR